MVPSTPRRILRLRLPFLTALVLSIIIPSSLFFVSPARSIPGPSDGLPTPGVDSPSNVWAPYGPFVNRLLFNFYTDPSQEFSEFELGRLDLTDPFTCTFACSKFAAYDTNPDFIQSVGQGERGMTQFEFNHYAGPGDNRWANQWNCNFDHANSLCGIAIRQSFAHLFDRATWVRVGPLNGGGSPIADPTAPAQTPAGSSLSTQQSWELLDGTHQTIDGRFPNVKASEDFAFHIAEACSNGFCSSIAEGPLNFCAAADEMLVASRIIQDAGGTPIATGRDSNCVLTGVNPEITAASGHIRMWVALSKNDPGKKDMGERMAGAINALFGATVVDLHEGNFDQSGRVVLVAEPEGATDDWEMATVIGWSLGNLAEHLFALFSSSAASNNPPDDVCDPTQVPNGYPNNYDDICIPAFDAASLAAFYAGDFNVFKSQTLNALNIFGSHAASIPAYSRGIRSSALRTVDGLVNWRGEGYSNRYSVLNGRACPATNKQNSFCETMPVDPIYAFGGGDPSTLRWGQGMGTSHLNPILVNFLIFPIFVERAEVNVVGQVYDTLFALNPVVLGQVFCWMCSSYTQQVDLAGNTHFTVFLKQNLEFQDGVPLTARDVAFSLLANRDVPSFLSYDLLGVTVYSETTLDIVMWGQSLTHLIELAGVPIIPQHIMGSGDDFYSVQSGTYGGALPSQCKQINGAFCAAPGVSTVIPAKTQESYDPIAVNEFIGSGPFACVSQGYVGGPSIGTVGGGCVKTPANTNGGQTIAPGSSMLLTKFDFSTGGNPFDQYHRSFNPAWGSGSQSGQYQEWSWADVNNDGIVDALDVGQVSLCTTGVTVNCSASQLAYWQRLYPSVTQDTAVVISHLDDSWVAPFSWSTTSLENIVPFAP